MSIKFEQARQARILNLLIQAPTPLTSQYLATYFNISQRLIRYDIQILKEKISLYPCHIISIRGTGYKIEGDISELQKEMKKELGELYYYDHIDTKDKFIREQLILRYLLIKNSIATTKELIEYFYITRATLKEDIIRAKETIEPYHMKIHFIPYKGVYLEGTETNKRMLLSRETAFYKESPLLDHIQKEMSYIHFPIHQLIQFVNEYFHIPLSNIEAYNLYVHIWIMFYRIWQNNIIDKDDLNCEMITDTQINISYKFLNRYIPWLHAPYQEACYLTLLILSSGPYYDPALLPNAIEMIHNVEEKTHIHLSENFQYDLTSILYPIIIKSQNQISSNSIMIREIKKKSPLSIDIAYKLSLQIKKYYHIDLFDNDICTIAYLVHNYLQQSYQIKNNIIVLTTSIGYILSLGLLQKLNHEFPTVHFIYLELYEIETFDFNNCNLIISDTFIEKKPTNVHFIKINLMCTQKDLNKIQDYIHIQNKKKTEDIFNQLEETPFLNVQTFLTEISKKYSMNYNELIARENKITFETNKNCVIICDYSSSHQSHGFYSHKGIYWKNATIHYFFYLNILNHSPFHYYDIENYLYQLEES